MPLAILRSTRFERLADRLAKDVAASAPRDPFVAVPVVVGSAGMARALRQHLATRLGAAVRLAFPFPRPALEGAIDAVLAGEEEGPFWEREAQGRDVEALALALLPHLRRRLAAPGFEHLGRWWRQVAGRRDPPGPDEPVGARELDLARQVAEVLDRLAHHRPASTLAMAREPASAPPPDRWLARLAADIGLGDPEGPLARLERLQRLHPRPAGPGGPRPVFLFGLSTLGAGELVRLLALAPHLRLRLYLPVPSAGFLGDHLELGAGEGDDLASAARGTPGTGRNPLLVSMAQPIVRLRHWVEGLEPGDAPVEDIDLDEAAPAPERRPGTDLARIQHWIRCAAPPEELELVGDGTVVFHDAHGPMRQAEVLREAILRALAEREDLHPRDVVALTPDPEAHAPLVAAVLGRRGEGVASTGRAVPLPELPVAVADLGLAATNPLAALLLELLRLVEQRVRAGDLLALAELPPMRRRFGLDDAALEALRAEVQASGMRWGLDAGSRARAGLPRQDPFTVRFGIERLLLATTIPDDPEGLRALPGDRAHAPVAPLDPGCRPEPAGALALAALQRWLLHLRREGGGGLPPARWRDELLAALDGLAEVPDAQAWLGLQVREGLARLVEQAPAGLAWTAGAVRAALRGAFDLARRGDLPCVGAVTVAALRPMRAIPARLLAVVGADDGSLPRRQPHLPWDPLRRPPWRPERVPRWLEHGVREVDLQVLLESLLSARDRWLVLWTGRDPRTGETRPPATPIANLLELLGRSLAPGAGLERLHARHALHPWDEPERVDRALLAAGPGGGPAAAATPAPTPPVPAPREVAWTAAELAGRLCDPLRALARRLGVATAWRERDPDDLLPVELEGLGRWEVDRRLLPALVAEGLHGTAPLRRRLEAEGGLPVGRRGQAAFGDRLEALRACLETAELEPGAGGGGGEIACEVAGVRLRALLPARDGAGVPVFLSPSADRRGRLRLEAWAALLVGATDGGLGSVRATWSRGGGEFTRWDLHAPPPAEARERLEALVRLARRAESEALPCPGELALSLARAIREHGGDPGAALGSAPEALLEAARDAWWGGWSAGGRGLVADPLVRLLLPHWEPEAVLDPLHEAHPALLAWQVWGPLLAAAGKGAP